MSDIDLPGTKQFLWHRMRSDLISFVPEFADNELLLCPTCCRRMKYENFSVEHIIPKQALANDPAEIKAKFPHNERSGLTLLCSRPLVVKGKRIPGNGCNSWKGKHYDKIVADSLGAKALHKMAGSDRNIVALILVGFLGLFRKYGYQIVLSQAGLVMRKQFFWPNGFVKDLPLKFQMILTRDKLDNESDEQNEYWTIPFKTVVDDTSAMVLFRNFSVSMPLSRNPETFLPRSIQYMPSKYAFRPDLTTVFD